jgi:dihydrolipoamide dehydrogenase
MEGLLANNGVEVIRGRGVLKSPRSVDVEGKIFEAKKIILAMGSRLDFPAVPGLEEAALTTDQVLEMTEAPLSILVWGSGPIELEMATILNVFGSKVYLATKDARLLPREDHDTSQRIAQALREQGVELLPRFVPESVQRSGGGYACRLSGPETRVVEVDHVLVSSREPNTADMGLEQVGVRVNEDRSIWVNETLETSVRGVFAIGDATGGWMLSHASSAMAVTAAENAMGKTNAFSSRLIPRGIWAFPQVGAVGLSEEEAEERGLDIEVGDFPYSINGLAMVRDEMYGSVKVITETQYGEIVGVHIVGANATELVGEAALAMQLETTAQELAYSIRVHPTFSEAVVDAARDAGKWALYLPRQ